MKYNNVQKSHENGSDDGFWMGKALREAEKARAKCEVPIGCVIVRDGAVIARGHNLRESRQDPAGHAELIAIRKAARKLSSWRLTGCTLYVTLEPCTMCMGAILLARIPTVVFGCFDPKGGAAGSLYDFSLDTRFNHQVTCRSLVREAECSALLKDFFSALRREKQKAILCAKNGSRLPAPSENAADEQNPAQNISVDGQ